MRPLRVLVYGTVWNNCYRFGARNWTSPELVARCQYILGKFDSLLLHQSVDRSVDTWAAAVKIPHGRIKQGILLKRALRLYRPTALITMPHGQGTNSDARGMLVRQHVPEMRYYDSPSEYIALLFEEIWPSGGSG
jgi:hypothetical protein